MGLDSRTGVVDPEGRVFGLENLYIAGASIFPTAGYANPTLTVIATALRLATHVDAALG
jgi:choline dehydrogenase-like flavoprotein